MLRHSTLLFFLIFGCSTRKAIILEDVVIYPVPMDVLISEFHQSDEGMISLRGTIVDSTTRSPIIGANVSSGTIRTLTDQKGAFILNGIKESDSLTLSYIGYQKKSVKVLLDDERLRKTK